MIVGTEWLIEAFDCDPRELRSVESMQFVFSRLIGELGLKVLGDPQWHKFDGGGGVTGLVMLTESHLACHTYPEFRTATFNLYCCRSRPEWPWAENLRQLIGAGKVEVTRFVRGSEARSQRIVAASTSVGGEF